MASRSNGLKTAKIVTNSRGSRTYTRTKVTEGWKITGWSGKSPLQKKPK